MNKFRRKYPKNNANINPFKLSPPKKNIAIITSKTVNEVLKVLPSVLEIESSNNPAKVRDFSFQIFSNSVEYNYGIIYRITEYCKNRSDKVLVNLHVEWHDIFKE